MVTHRDDIHPDFDQPLVLSRHDARSIRSVFGVYNQGVNRVIFANRFGMFKYGRIAGFANHIAEKQNTHGGERKAERLEHGEGTAQASQCLSYAIAAARRAIRSQTLPNYPPMTVVIGVLIELRAGQDRRRLPDEHELSLPRRLLQTLSIRHRWACQC